MAASPDIPPSVLATADRQRALVNDTLAKLVNRARVLLAKYDDATSAWAILGTELARAMHATGGSGGEELGAELIAAAAILLAQDPTASPRG